MVIEERVNRLVEEIKRFCERVGGKVKHVKTVHTHHISCIFDRERKVSVDYLGDMDLMLITVDDKTEKFYGVPKQWLFSIKEEEPWVDVEEVAGRISPEASVITSRVIANGFDVYIDRDYNRMKVELT